MDSKALYKLSYGLYLLTTRSNGRDNGCIVDAVVQAASKPPRIAVCVMNGNYTKQLLLESGEFNLSVLTEDTPAEVFSRFGMQSGRVTDKFEGSRSTERKMD